MLTYKVGSNGKKATGKFFMISHINDIARGIDQKLPSRYEVSLNRSLQIREYHPDSGDRIRYPEPDVTIYDRERINQITSQSLSNQTVIYPR